MEHEFEVGDEVELIEGFDSRGNRALKVGMTGRIVDLGRDISPADSKSVGIDFGEDINGHDCEGNCIDDYGYYLFVDGMKLINKEQEHEFEVGDEVELLKDYGGLEAGGKYKFIRYQGCSKEFAIIDHDGERSFLAPPPRYLRPVTATNTRYSNLIIHCKTESEYKRVLEKLGSDLSKDNWENNYKEDTLIYIHNTNDHTYGKLEYYLECKKEGDYKGYTFLTAREFLGEEINGMTMSNMFVDEAGDMQELYNNCVERMEAEYNKSFYTSPEFNKLSTKDKIMSTIKKAFMSDEDRAVQHFELGTDAKNLNEKGLVEFLEFIYAVKKEIREGFLEKLVEGYKKEIK